MAIFLWIQLHYITSDNHDNFSKIIREISRIVSIREFFKIDIQDDAVLLVSLGITAVYFLVFGLIFGVIVWNFMNKTNMPARINIATAYFAQFHLAIGFWVINMILIDYLSAGLDSITEATTLQLIIFIGYFLLISLNYLLGFLFATYSYDPFLTSNILSCHTSTFRILLFLSKGILASIITSSNNSNSTAWALVAFAVVTIGISYAYLMHAFPYYHYSAMKTSILFCSTNFLIAIVNFGAMIAKNFQQNIPPTILIYGLTITIPLLLKVATMHFDSIILKYLALQNHNLKSKNQVYKKILALTLMMDKVSLTLNSKKEKSSILGCSIPI